MIKESKYFKFTYSESDNNYIDKLVDVIDKKAKTVLDFFEIESIKRKFNVIIVPTKKEFSRLIWNEIHFKDDEYGIGFVKDEMMYCLSFNDYKSTFYTFYKFENFVSTIIHEFVHACHQYKTDGKTSIRCVNEGLACYLANQYDSESLKLDASIEDIQNDKYVKYDNYYIIMKYILDNYDKEYCDKIIYEKDFARSKITEIYNNLINSLGK